jgi:hypothetical protein
MSSLSPAGQPSIIPPIAAPCDSPKEVNLNNSPKLFDAINTTIWIQNNYYFCNYNGYKFSPNIMIGVFQS